MSDFTWADIQRQEDGEPPAPLVFTGEWMSEHFGPNGPDEDDVEAMNLAMERDMADREGYWRDRALAAEQQLREEP